MVRRLLPFAGVLVALVAARASADPAPQDARAAQSLFEAGRALMERGELDRACRMLAESQRLDAGGGALLNLALCHEKQGKIATAWDEYTAAIGVAIKDARKDREDFARAHMDAIRPRLPKLSVRAPAKEITGLEVRLDGATIAPMALGLPVSVDPGVHEVSASAPGRVPWSSRREALEGQTPTVEVPDLALAPPPLVPPTPQTPPNTPVTTRKRIAPAAYAVGTVALVGYGASIVTGLMALSAQSDANGACSAARQFCSPSGKDDVSRTRTFAWISTASLGVGIAATAAAILWPREHVVATEPSAVVAPVLVAGGGGGIVASGSF